MQATDVVLTIKEKRNHRESVNKIRLQDRTILKALVINNNN